MVYVVQRYVKVAHIPPGSGANLNLDKEIITRAPIIDTRSNLRLNQDSLHWVYVSH